MYKLKFGYDPIKIKQIKECCVGREWKPDDKSWVFPVCKRNTWFMMLQNNINVYEKYDKPLKIEKIDGLWEHQNHMYSIKFHKL